MKRLIAFALALAAVFGVSFALYRPELAQNAAQDSADDEWVGYFFSLEPFDGKRYAERADDRYDFGVPGVPMFVSITAFSPDDPYYEEDSAFNYSIGMAASEEVERSGLHVFGDDNGDRYETGGSILLDAQCSTELYACDVFRTADGRYYAVCTGEGCCGDSFGLSRSETLSWTPNGKKQSRTVSVSASLEAHTAAESAAFVWMDGEKNVLSRAEYPADAIVRPGGRGAAGRNEEKRGRHAGSRAFYGEGYVCRGLRSFGAFRPSARRLCDARVGREHGLTNI